MFYIKQNDVVVLADNDKTRLENTILFKPELKDSIIEETKENETIVDFQLMTQEEANEIIDQKEQDRINHLTMTALDFIKVLQSTGLTSQQIKEYLDSNVDLDMQLKYCQNVYCGVVRQLMPLTVGEITITDEMVVAAFEVKNSEGTEIIVE